MAPKSSAKLPKPEVIDPERESLQAPVDPAVRCAESEQQARWQARTRAETLERHALVFIQFTQLVLLASAAADISFALRASRWPA